MEKSKENPYFFKKGDKKQVIIYRPIDLTLVLINLFKKIIRDKMVAFFEINWKQKTVWIS